MKQRKHRGNQTFEIVFQTIRRTSAGKVVYSPKQTTRREGCSRAQVLKGFMFGRDPQSIILH